MDLRGVHLTRGSEKSWAGRSRMFNKVPKKGWTGTKLVRYFIEHGGDKDLISFIDHSHLCCSVF